ncbi:MAG: hypothetical protein GXP28_09840 [Planctomycetes bacterium]|nr:hypothetical protein [Planctomycetota bacterium]
MVDFIFRVGVFRVGVVLAFFSSAILPTQADELGELTKRVAALEGSVKSLESVVYKNASQINDLTSNINGLAEALKLSTMDLSDRMTNQDAKQQQILDQIMSTDEQGEVYLTLSSIMTKSAVAREEVRKAVEQSIRTQGTLTIVNEMGTAQDILVNRIQHHVHAGATLNLTVPVGTASTQLPGQELVNWTIGIPNYRQSVSIKPRRHSAARVSNDLPISGTWISQPTQPLYYGYETPIYHSGDHWWHNDHWSHGGHSWHNNHSWHGGHWWGNHHAYH